MSREIRCILGKVELMNGVVSLIFLRMFRANDDCGIDCVCVMAGGEMIVMADRKTLEQSFIALELKN